MTLDQWRDKDQIGQPRRLKPEKAVSSLLKVDTKRLMLLSDSKNAVRLGK